MIQTHLLDLLSLGLTRKPYRENLPTATAHSLAQAIQLGTAFPSSCLAESSPSSAVIAAAAAAAAAANNVLLLLLQLLACCCCFGCCCHCCMLLLLLLPWLLLLLCCCNYPFCCCCCCCCAPCQTAALGTVMFKCSKYAWQHMQTCCEYLRLAITYRPCIKCNIPSSLWEPACLAPLHLHHTSSAY